MDKAARDDIRSILDKFPKEADAVLNALYAGLVDGGTYCGDGSYSCGCLFGVIARARGFGDAIVCPDMHELRNPGRPAEMFFRGIVPSDTPENDRKAKEAARVVAQWIEEQLAAGKEV